MRRGANNLHLQIDLPTLRVLVAIAQHNSFVGAAHAVNIVPSAVSRRIQELEAAVGLQLVKRTPRAVEFTGAGKVLLKSAYRILSEVDSFAIAANELGKGTRGNVRLAVSRFALYGTLPTELASFRRRQPRIDLELKLLSSRDVLAAMHKQQIDVGVFAATEVPAGLRAIVHSEDRMTALVHARHPLASRSTVGFADLAAHEIIGPPDGSESQHLLGDQARRRGLRMVQSFQADSLDAMVLMARAGIGIAVIPQAAWTALGPFRGLKQLQIDEPWSHAQLLVGMLADVPVSSPAFMLFNHLVNAEHRAALDG